MQEDAVYGNKLIIEGTNAILKAFSDLPDVKNFYVDTFVKYLNEDKHPITYIKIWGYDEYYHDKLLEHPDVVKQGFSGCAFVHCLFKAVKCFVQL